MCLVTELAMSISFTAIAVKVRRSHHASKIKGSVST